MIDNIALPCKRLALVGLLALIVIGCAPAEPAAAGKDATLADASSDQQEPPNENGRPFLAELGGAIRDADRVVVVEHSSMYDFTDMAARRGKPDLVYKSVPLSEAQRSRLLEAVDGTEPFLDGFASACIFQPHHRVEMYRAGKRTRTLEICFTCGQLSWDGVAKGEPRALYDSMGRFIRSIGLQPERNWDELASSR